MQVVPDLHEQLWWPISFSGICTTNHGGITQPRSNFSLQVVPDLHEQLWCSSSGDSCVMRGVSNVFMRLSSLLACLNSALNFFIYYVSSAVHLQGDSGGPTPWRLG